MKKRYLVSAASLGVFVIAGLAFYLTSANNVNLSADAPATAFTCKSGGFNGCTTNSAIKFYAAKEEYNSGEKVDVTLEFAFDKTAFDSNKYRNLTWSVEDSNGKLVYLSSQSIRSFLSADKKQWSWDLKSNTSYMSNGTGNIKDSNGRTYKSNPSVYKYSQVPAGEYKIKTYANSSGWTNRTREIIGYIPVIITGQVDVNSFISVKTGVAITFGVDNISTKSVGFKTAPTWSVKDKTGKVVYASPSTPIMSGIKAGETAKLTWDQKDNTGTQVPVGNYTINIVSRNEFYTALAVHIEQ